MEAIMLIVANQDEKARIADALLDMPGILNAYPVYGAFDIVARADVENLGKFQRIMKRTMPEIQMITTLLPKQTGSKVERFRKKLIYN